MMVGEKRIALARERASSSKTRRASSRGGERDGRDRSAFSPTGRSRPRRGMGAAGRRGGAARPRRSDEVSVARVPGAFRRRPRPLPPTRVTPMTTEPYETWWTEATEGEQRMEDSHGRHWRKIFDAMLERDLTTCTVLDLAATRAASCACCIRSGPSPGSGRRPRTAVCRDRRISARAHCRSITSSHQPSSPTSQNSTSPSAARSST